MTERKRKESQIMKRGPALALTLCAMMMPFAALAEEGIETEFQQPRKSITLTGSIAAGETKPVFAPFGGMVGASYIQDGDIVRAGDPLFTIETTKVYAPCDGVIGSLRIQAGDDAASVQERYGALLYVEPSGTFVIETDTTYAYGNEENQIVHVGETVYIGSRNSSERMGTGFVTFVENDAFTVEVTSGNLIMDDNVSIFRQSDFAPASKIGSGTTARKAVVPVVSEGSLFAVHVAQGDRVNKGDLLLETVLGSLDYNAYPTNQVVSGYHAVVATTDAAVGEKVEKKQSMATLHPVDTLRVVVHANESDLRNIQLGDSVSIECSGLAESQLFDGTVHAISGFATDVDGQPYFPVTIEFAPRNDVRIGMSAIVYFNQ